MKKEDKAVGLLDSGLGGLSVYKELKIQLPLEQIIYYGDTIHSPYGEKTDKQILSYVISIIDFLVQKEIKLIIIGCNTATTVALEKTKDRYNIPIIGIIQAGAQEAIRKTRNKRIGIIGTKVTIRNKIYERTIKEIDSDIIIYSNACSNQIIREMEEHSLKNENSIKELLKECIKPLLKNKIDTLVWGCTHYPFLKKYLDQEIYSDITMINPAEATIREAKRLLEKLQLNHSHINKKEDIFFISGDTNLFAEAAYKLLGFLPGKFQKPLIS